MSNIKSRNNTVNNNANKNSDIKIFETVPNILVNHKRLSPKFKRRKQTFKALDIHTISTQDLKAYYETTETTNSVKHKVVQHLWPLDISREEKIENKRVVVYSKIHEYIVADVESDRFDNTFKSKPNKINSYIIEISMDDSKFYVVSINLSDRRKIQAIKFYK